MRTPSDDVRRRRRTVIRDGVITIVAVALAFAALDDITTDIDSSFTAERSAMIGAAFWFVIVAWRTWRFGHQYLGPVSIAVAIAAAIAFETIGPGTIPGPTVVYLVAVFGLVWFTSLAGILVWLGWRA